MKRLNKKGFTLVEVIVVLVILAILIAIAVPSVMKYIDDAKDAQIMAQAKGFVQEVELTMIEELGKREATTWREFENLVDEELQRKGYDEGVIGEGLLENFKFTEDWKLYSISYTIDDKYDDAVNSNRDSKIIYSNAPRIQNIIIFMVRKTNGSTHTRTYKYTPNEEFKLVSKYPK